MLLLPQVKKGFKRALTGFDKVQKVIAAVALGLGVGLTVLPTTDAQAAATATAQNVQQPAGSLLFAAPGRSGDVVADHYSHSSHASHASHASHYSSRYSG
jgi:hypothetical protein